MAKSWLLGSEEQWGGSVVPICEVIVPSEDCCFLPQTTCACLLAINGLSGNRFDRDRLDRRII